MMYKMGRFKSIPVRGILLYFLILMLSNQANAQITYYVSNQGNDSNTGTSESSSWKTIGKVSSINFIPGDIVNFKSGQKFSDDVLDCKNGVTYKTYGGTDQAIIGDSLGSTSSLTTIQINSLNVTLNNLKIYGYSYSPHIISYGAGSLTIENCEIVGGRYAHSRGTVGIYQTNSTDANGLNLTFTHNKIHGVNVGIYLAHPHNVDISYNDMYDLWRTGGTRDHGGYGIGYRVTTNGHSPADTWDAQYTYNVHNNHIHDFEYVAFEAGVSRMIYEYNEIDHNLDETIFMGGCKHGSVGKLWDDSGDTLGCIGLVFRYNYVHDLIRRGKANYTYQLITDWTIKPTHNIVVSTNNGTGRAIYLGAGLNPTTDPNYGDDVGEGPDGVLSGLGRANFWIHNNLFYNCSNKIAPRAYSQAQLSNFQTYLGSYFVNNTIINCGFCQYVTNNGIFLTEYTSQSPTTIINNIVDFNNPTSKYCGWYKEQSLYLDYNIYTRQNGTVSGSTEPALGSQKAAYFQAGDEISDGTHEKYLTNPNWVDTSSRIFVQDIGVNGAYIPDCRIKKGGNAYNSGRAYSLIGDSYTDSYGKHQLGKDPTGRSFAYDLLGNLRTGNDIGAVGTGGITESAGLRVILEGPYKENGEMKTTIMASNLVPLEQPYDQSPWNINDKSIIKSVSSSYVDWILVQLRDNLTDTKYSKAALLTNNGTVINSDGSLFSFSNISSGQYYIVIRHRNHISIMSSTKVQINDNEEVNYDFTDSESKAYGQNPMADLGNNKFAMIAGDTNADGVIDDSDFKSVGKNIFTLGYAQEDLDMNGAVNVLDYYFINKNISKSANPNINIVSMSTK